MKVIQWYPGHMAKAMREMGENLKLCDAVVFVLDARAPASSYNPRLKELAGEKPVLFVLAKGDLAAGTECLATFREMNLPAVQVSLTEAGGTKVLRSAISALTEEKRKRYLQKGVSRAVRVMVAGVPNTGKSTLINLLAGARKAITGDKAGVTRTQSWVKLGEYDLLDTPGTMPPAFENQTFARRLAYVGCLNDDILEPDEIALCLLEELFEKAPAALKERYGIEGGEPLKMLEAVCARRGFLLKGGDFDYERGEKALIDDFRKGKLGKITLDTKADVAAAFGG